MNKGRHQNSRVSINFSQTGHCGPVIYFYSYLYFCKGNTLLKTISSFIMLFESLPKVGFLSVWAGQSALRQSSPYNYLYLQTIHRQHILDCQTSIFFSLIFCILFSLSCLGLSPSKVERYRYHVKLRTLTSEELKHLATLQ